MRAQENAKAITTKKMFSRTTTISTLIYAKKEEIWKILINGEDYTGWNSTITHFEGKIEKGNTVRLKSHLDAKRTFKLKVKEFETHKKLTWGDAVGNRTFLLEPKEGGTLFQMTETIGGPFFPLFARMIPEFDKSFEKFTNDLEQEILRVKNS